MKGKICMSNYPANFKGIEGQEEEKYLYEVHGEVEVEGYSEDDANHNLKENLSEILMNAYYNGDIEIT